MEERLQRLHSDKMAMFDRELAMVLAALDRAYVDHKDPCSVLRAIRVEFTRDVTCSPNLMPAEAGYVAPEFLDFEASPVTKMNWRQYDGLYDDFHYDIGHGKGTGEGSIDSAPVNDGYNAGLAAKPILGDRETSYGAATRTYELPRNARGGALY